jgi:hypothetical protein
MTLQLELWQLLTFGVGLLLSCFAAAFAAGKVLGTQWQRGLDQRFESLDKARVEGSTALRETLNLHLAQEKEFQVQIANLEREFLTWRGDLPLSYVRREDHIRMQTVIEAKLDGLALRIENQQLKGGRA